MSTVKCLCVSNVSPDIRRLSSHQQLRRRMWLRLLPVIKMMLNIKSCRNRTRQLVSTVSVNPLHLHHDEDGRGAATGCLQPDSASSGPVTCLTTRWRDCLSPRLPRMLLKATRTPS